MSKSKSSQSSDLFITEPAASQTEEQVTAQSPLAVRMRPRNLEEVAGQKHLLDEGKLLRRIIRADRLSSLIFYGPPGCGKTSLARIISKETKAQFVSLNAVESSVADLRQVIQKAQYLSAHHGKRTVLFVDEIHRFNRAQQDVLMPDVENGILILIGATTQNPSFSINGPLLSRATILELRSLEEPDVIDLCQRALRDVERGLGTFKVDINEPALIHIAKNASGDARRALNALEVGVLTTPPDEEGIIRFNERVAEESCQKRIVYHDREGDYHYDVASAFIKSMRGSDVDASLYWLAKMIYAGEDIRFIVRRLLILASEDIGNADPQALILAASGMQAVEFVGMPESRIILSQLVTYLALAPKSNASYLAIEKALEDVKTDKSENVPDHLRDAHYSGAKKMGHGEGYKYAHSYPNHHVEQSYINKNVSFYAPTEQGFEKVLRERLNHLKKTSRTDPK